MATATVRDRDIMHGVPIFRGTRVPVQTLFDHLVCGETLEAFLTGFPTVSRALAVQALEEASELLMAESPRVHDGPGRIRTADDLIEWANACAGKGLGLKQRET